MFQLIYHFIMKKKWRYLLIVTALVIYDVSLVIPTKIIEQVVDLMTKGQLTSQLLVNNAIYLIFVTVISYVTAYIWARYLFQSSVEFRLNLQKQAFKKLLKMRTPFFDKFRSGDVMTRFTTDSEGLKELVGFGLMVVFYAGGTVLFVIPVMFFISWSVSLFAIIPLLLLAGCIYFLGKKQDVLVEKNRNAIASLSDEVLEVIEGIRVIRAYSKKEDLFKKFQASTQKLARQDDYVRRYQSAYGPLFFFFLGISTVIILLMGANGIQDGTLTLGQIIALQLYASSLVEPFWMLAEFILTYQVGKTSFEKINELLVTGDELEKDGKIILTKPEEIVFDHYSFTYPNGSNQSLSDISLRIKAGETLGVVGKTGSGKTTFVRQFLRQYPVGQGVFNINQRPVVDYQKTSIEDAISYVPQEHILFSKSVGDNIAVGNADASQEDILKAIETAAFTDDLNRMSKGLETAIGEKGVSISGGQKQRISIARAFLKNPDILILDDSLSAVDAKTEQAIIDNIQKERQEKTTIIVTHRLSAVNHADWVIVLEEGKIVEAGKPADLIANKGWYYEQYLRQQTKED
ncbi:ABC transporter ATP-binding protein [Streptococcus sp. CSL10205-OR2]|uniref:ABC transporter ATP-binding protein n=1 Tax=Streptococcus sp. CSL10205-OR2 TaxID=2980558 RepID=UPI0021D85ED6|nr:ABC transporter ATP-binding protein [Streptococcus sp. CSL10205-OR2]MCU9534059.1 ABC transporter ATP-binding protein/permease [Streptococcus sp. CSL10205-OR2]